MKKDMVICMKKKIILVILGVLLVGVMAGCSENTLKIKEISKDFTNIEISEDSTGMILTLDENQSADLYDKLKEISFIKDKATDDGTERRYSLRFMKGERELNQFAIIDEETIEFRGDLHKAKDSEMELDYLKTLFYQIFEAEVIEGGEYLLVAPDKASDAYRSSDKISVALLGAEVKDSAGNKIGGDQLKAGDIVKISFNGVILESYPAQITANIVELLDHNILIDGYMALIDDIYQEDSGLNGEITMLAFDSTDWIGLSEIEKETILSLVEEKYGLETLQGTFDELAEQGLIDKENLYFEKGVLIEISEMEYDADNKTIKGSISKWRGGLGAIGADVKAKLEGDKWKITKTNQWIS
ncbi:MAG TPA: hypothetical protein VJZ06_07610 [Mobilitalea sp.]|nr:hypothetical protein [Mobilitalea sp.]